MAEFTALSHGVYCVDALYVKPGAAALYLLQQEEEVAIIDTGTAHSLPNLLATMQQLDIAKSQIKYVIPTHVHLDHAAGAGAMLQQFDQAQLIIHPRGAKHMIDPTALVASTIEVYGKANFARLYGHIEPVARARVIIAEDNDCFELKSRQLVFFNTEGHARHHFCIYDATSGGVFSGDSFGVSYQPMQQLERGLIPSTPPTQFDPAALHESVARIMQFNPQKLYLTHYGEYLNPAAQVDSFKRWIDTYVELCQRVNPVQQDADEELQQCLQEVLLRDLSANIPDLKLVDLINHDLRLNAQGLGHWWRREMQ